MKKLLLLCVGLIPFFLGFGLNAVIMANTDSVPPLKLLGLAFLLLWCFFGYLMRDLAGSERKSVIFAHLIALAFNQITAKQLELADI